MYSTFNLTWRVAKLNCYREFSLSVHTSIIFRCTADMLVSNNVQWSIGKSTFTVAMGQLRQLTVQVLYIITQIIASSIYKPQTGNFVCCPIVTEEVPFPNWPLYVVGHQHVSHVMEEYGRARTLYSTVDQTLFCSLRRVGSGNIRLVCVCVCVCVCVWTSSACVTHAQSIWSPNSLCLQVHPVNL